MISFPFWIFLASIIASLLCLSAYIRSKIDSEIHAGSDLRRFAAAGSFCMAPSLVVLTIRAMHSPVHLKADFFGAELTPIWILVGLPILAAYCATGLSIARLGPIGFPPFRVSSASKVPWFCAALVAPAIALLDTISPIEIFFMLLACAAAFSIAGADGRSLTQPGLHTGSFVSNNARLYAVLLGICSFTAAGSLVLLPPQTPSQLLVLGVLFIGMVVSLLIPMVVATAQAAGCSPSIIHLSGDVYLLLLVLGCTALVGYEITQEFASAAGQLRENIDAGLPPVFFRTHDLKVAGFARAAPVLFMAIPLAGLALIPSQSEPTGSERLVGASLYRLVGVLLAGFSLVVLAWNLSAMLGR